MQVNLTYFKPSGKYYSSGDFFVPLSIHLFEVFEMVRKMQFESKLPGINGNEWNVLIGVPDHPHNHPHLLLTLKEGI